MDASYSYPIASQAQAADRGLFLQRTYVHTAGAILAFAALCAVLVNSPVGQMMSEMIQNYRWSWMVILGAFMVTSWVADHWAESDTSVGLQYAGLSIAVVAWSILFTPLLYIAVHYVPASDMLLYKAGFMTLFLFGGITTFAFITRKDFSWLGGVLTVGSFIAMGFIAAGCIFNFSLGLVFCAAMMVFASGSILYTTSNMIHVYRTDQHVAASLALFSGIALLFWYIIQILLRSRD